MDIFTAEDSYYFREGTHTRLPLRLGTHFCTRNGEAGASFAVWAPNAESVAAVGDFNGWSEEAGRLARLGDSGVWAGFVPYVRQGQLYKYRVRAWGGFDAFKADPFGFRHEQPPGSASVVWDLGYEWNDAEWMVGRRHANSLDAPWSIYEVHLGSWRRGAGDRWLTYRELGEQLVPYVKETGFTHVEFLPLMEHPFYGSWGYQATGYFAPTSRYGTPQDLMWLIDRFHQNGIGVILDWVPSHFPQDDHGLANFDGVAEYESAGVHPDWHTLVFDYKRGEVRSFLLSSAMFWLERYHADALRVDAVASMLYLDYSRKEGEWTPNEYGGRENLAAIAFLKEMNSRVYAGFPDTQTIAEESTAWPAVSRPAHMGGLGFGMKWDMGWMHDTLKYMSQDPLFRKYHHQELTFRAVYAFNENFVLPLSHDEVSGGQGSLIGRMPGDNWQKFANLRLLVGYMYAQPGKKLLFMGDEFGQWTGWNHDQALDWPFQDSPLHAGVRLLVGDLNHLYRRHPALQQGEFNASGFEWIDCQDAENDVLSFLRKSPGGQAIAAVCNFSAVARPNYRIGVPASGFWKELLNSDGRQYGGSGQGNLGGVESVPIPLHGRPHSLTLTLPPLAVVLLEQPAV